MAQVTQKKLGPIKPFDPCYKKYYKMFMKRARETCKGEEDYKGCIKTFMKKYEPKMNAAIKKCREKKEE